MQRIILFFLLLASGSLFLLLLVSGCQGTLVSTQHPDLAEATSPDLASLDLASPDLAKENPAENPDLAQPAMLPMGGPVLYPAGQRHAPISAALRDRWRAIIGPGRTAKNFVRLGDNLSHEVHLLGCADQSTGAGALQATIDYFDGGSIKGGTPWVYQRDLENYSTDAALAGSPDLQAQEIATGNPAYAFVMFGSLDLQWAGVWDADPATDPDVIRRFGPNLLKIVDELLAAGVLPVVRTIAPVGKTNNGPWNRRVTMVNALTRAVAAGRQLPFADFWLDARNLGPDAYWSDGLHLSASPNGACDFTQLQYGDNLMSLVALEEMDRVRRAVVGGEVLDPTPPGLGGDGTSAHPFVVSGIPFGTMGSGVYRLTVTATTKVRVMVFGNQSQVQHQVGGVNKRADSTLLALELAPGDHDFVVSGNDLGFAVDACDTADTACTPDN
jgi:hypothetical protein